MLMRDHPLAVNLVEANGRAPPHVELSSVCPRCTNVAKAVGEREGLARRDAEVAYLVTNRALERREPLLRAFSRRVRSDMLQRVYDVERQDVRRVVGHSAVNVPGADRLCTIVDYGAYLSFIDCFAIFCGHIIKT